MKFNDFFITNVCRQDIRSPGVNILTYKWKCFRDVYASAGFLLKIYRVRSIFTGCQYPVMYLFFHFSINFIYQTSFHSIYN